MADTAAIRTLDTAARGGALASGAEAGGRGLRAVKLVVGLLMLPVAYGFSLGFSDYFLSAKNKLFIGAVGWPEEARWFLGGMLGFTLLAALLWRPLLAYVFAHELVHALATWLCLGKVSNLSASAGGGKVTTSKSNTFIRLAPYVVPLYALLWAGAWLGLDAWWHSLEEHRWALAFGLGVLTAFHLGFTLWSLQRGQPDLQPDGWFFSLLLIYLGNVVVLAAIAGLTLSGEASGAWNAVKGVCGFGWERTADLYGRLGQALGDALRRH